jgi:hypothetical protein
MWQFKTESHRPDRILIQYTKYAGDCPCGNSDILSCIYLHGIKNANRYG